ncbi:exonuclease SbcCD subunit D [Rhodospirillum sp. A1_3_36]|uniref:exonuclease SbcCD subunit D n=1 Tax=Rhodospirillum sp. A1_3_36 TaxID=3391666 RepID=UPI0039A5158C
MKILHTGDLHLGRAFNGISLDQDHEAILHQILQVLVNQAVDVLIIAGDIFDRAAPPASAIRQFNDFLSRVSRETTAALVMIAGNHDSGDRVATMAVLSDGTRALVRGVVTAQDAPLVLRDDHGPVAFSALPFAHEYTARECFGEETIASPADVLAAQVAAARQALPPGIRWVITAHAFVAGGQGSESERSLARVGGIETVPCDVFDGAHYVALGHLHRSQRAGADHIRYAGAPLAFGFDEADSSKSMTLVTLDGTGATTVETIPFTPTRGIRVLKGRHAEVLLAPPSEDFIKVVLTDPHPIIDPMKPLRERFPNVCMLTYERDERVLEPRERTAQSLAGMDPLDVVGDFLEQVRGEPATEAERLVLSETLQALVNEEDAA